MSVVYPRVDDVFGRQADVAGARRIGRGAADREEELPVYERLGDMRSLLICRANIGMNYLARGSAGDRHNALQLLNMAFQDAQRLKLPEAGQFARIIQQIEHPSKPG